MNSVFNPFFDPLGIKEHQMKLGEDAEFGAISSYLRQKQQAQPDLEGFEREQQVKLGQTCGQLGHGHDAQIAARYKDQMTRALTRHHISPRLIPPGAWPDAPKLRGMCHLGR